MQPRPLARLLSAVAGGLAIIAMVGLSASCAKEKEKAPETTTPTTTTATSSASAPAMSPTEKKINPTGGKEFSPKPLAPTAPTTTANH
jgi:hypothetical protein